MRSRVMCALAVGTAVLAAACGGGQAGPAAQAPTSGASAGFPVTVDDCGDKRVEFTASPQRIVTSNASALEMLFWLGAGDRVIGTGFPPGKGTLPGSFATAAEKVPVLSDSVIPKEKLLGSGAELYIDTFASMNMGGGAVGPPTDQEFAAANIKHLYLKSTACASEASGPLTDLSSVENDIKRLGTATGTSAKADELVKGMRSKVDKVRDALSSVPENKQPSYFFFDFNAGTNQPIAACGKQVANAVITLAGARNVFADCDADFKPVGWEDVVARNPDWIQLGIRDKGNPEANKAAFAAAEKFLREFPATAGLEAVKRGRFLRVGSEQTTIPGVRNADTVVQIASTLHPDLVKADG
ncbi:iron ABC transporter substrate-binding protein [Longimycelium tulufanense]|uniref:Iron ABC transporter substrate-binding protein n=1 Tax=Longimycelium tulufanense TaxID=907463 RepID=A0A8J3FW57_9PSEU|nr:ABC transporter substrate-binding protein [Longimycelium tulufanense]GGM56952.1 iron ABC transporter substrate-binding protein [Longimycelium tulufanense]